jgi:hypothetical protein
MVNSATMEKFEILLRALKSRLAIVADHEFRDRDPSGHLNAIRKEAENLETIIRSLPGDIDPMLRHYLERQSYAKAITWLEEHLTAS